MIMITIIMMIINTTYNTNNTIMVIIIVIIMISIGRASRRGEDARSFESHGKMRARERANVRERSLQVWNAY